MKLGEIQKSMLTLMTDALEAEACLVEKDTQFRRRAFIRSFFGCAEGLIWLIKQVCLQAEARPGPKVITVAEYALLTEVSYDLTNKGDPSKRPKFLNLADNLKFTVKVARRFFGFEFDLGVGTGMWDKFVKAIAIRNRITHPKSGGELLIEDNEITLCKDACYWFNDFIHIFWQRLIESSTAQAIQAKNGVMPEVLESSVKPSAADAPLNVAPRLPDDGQ